MQFPLYRKLPNNKSWYRIDSERHMHEIVIIGKSYMVHEVEAKILPERNLINDLIRNEGERWIEITRMEFEGCVERCERELERK